MHCAPRLDSSTHYRVNMRKGFAATSVEFIPQTEYQQMRNKVDNSINLLAICRNGF